MTVNRAGFTLVSLRFQGARSLPYHLLRVSKTPRDPRNSKPGL
jgi:hypothetical protein